MADHRRCESCGQAMRPRMHRVTDENGKKICDNCARTGLNKQEWSVAYASLPPAYQREALIRDEATRAGLAVLAEVRKCPSCQGQGSYEDDDGRERSCPRCGGDGVLDAPTKTAASDATPLPCGCVVVHDFDSGKAHAETLCGHHTEAEAIAKADGPMDDEYREWYDNGGYDRWLRGGSLQTVAHDSGDGETIFHCPFCGSGAVTGGADGTVTCDFCHTAFTVQVQPKHTNMPQTINGQPYNVPGMPGGGPDAGAAGQQEADDQGDAQDGAPAPGDSPAADASKGNSPAADKAAQDGAQPPGAPKKPNPFAKGSMLVVPGGVLPVEAALRRLALDFADDRDAVLAQVREENAR